MTDTDRLCDLMRQGFMKPRPEPRKKKPEPPIVACDACLNWHREGKHTAPIEVRRARTKEAEGLAARRVVAT